MASCQLDLYNDDKTTSNSDTMNIIIKFIKEIMLCNILIETSILCPLYDIIWSDTSRIDAATMC